jgi:hypothetical protein
MPEDWVLSGEMRQFTAARHQIPTWRHCATRRRDFMELTRQDRRTIVAVAIAILVLTGILVGLLF